MFGLGKKKQPKTLGDLYSQIASATSESVLAQIMIEANGAGLLTSDIKRILYVKKDLLDEKTTERLRENAHAQNDGYWSRSVEENAKSAQDWNKKCRDEDLKKFESQVNSADMNQIHQLRHIEERKGGYHFQDRTKIDLIENRLSILIGNKEKR